MATLIRPPPVDDAQSAIENVLELTQLSDIDPDLFTNTRPMWLPPGARGIFGGAAIAQTLSAAQKTVDDDFTVHSMHCYFVLAGNAELPLIYHVERVRSGKSFATRTVQARQRGRVIFTTTMSFVRQNSGGKELVEHAYPMPDVPAPTEDTVDVDSHANYTSPFLSQRLPTENGAHIRTPIHTRNANGIQTTPINPTARSAACGSRPAVASHPPAATKPISPPLPTCPTLTSSAPLHACTNFGATLHSARPRPGPASTKTC